MDKAREWLSGKKTYLALVASLVATIIAWAAGEVEHKEVIILVVTEVVGIFFRAGVTKSGLKENDNA